jgi:predicted cobalt transporter CbtA
MKEPRRAVTGEEDYRDEGYRKTVAAAQSRCPGAPVSARASRHRGRRPQSGDERVVFGVVAVIVGILVVLLRLGVGDDD